MSSAATPPPELRLPPGAGADTTTSGFRRAVGTTSNANANNTLGNKASVTSATPAMARPDAEALGGVPAGPRPGLSQATLEANLNAQFEAQRGAGAAQKTPKSRSSAAAVARAYADREWKSGSPKKEKRTSEVMRNQEALVRAELAKELPSKQPKSSEMGKLAAAHAMAQRSGAAGGGGLRSGIGSPRKNKDLYDAQQALVKAEMSSVLPSKKQAAESPVMAAARAHICCTKVKPPPSWSGSMSHGGRRGGEREGGCSMNHGAAP